MAKVLLWGPAIWARTAYAKNLLNLGLRLKEAGHEVSQFAFAGLFWGSVEYQGIRVYPNNAEDYGQTWLPRWNHFLKPDITIWHYDAWVMGAGGFRGLPNLAIYSPVDHSPLPPPTKQALEGQEKVIAFSHSAEREYKAAGIKPFMYIPHAFDHLTYCPGDRVEARRRLRLPEDCFLLVSVGTNKGPRKNLGNVLRAFRKFLDQVPEARNDAFLYLHCNVYASRDNPSGYNLPEIWKGLNIADRIKYVHSVYYEAYGFTESELADVYRAADFSILCSLGEGFGLPLVESLGCGTPAIYSNFSSCPEVVGPGGLPVEASERIPFELSSSFQWMPSTEQIVQRIVEAYRDWQVGGKLRDELGAKGRRHILRNYTWERVMPSWLRLVEGAPAPTGMVKLPARGPQAEGEVDIILPSWQGLALGLLDRFVEALYTRTKLPFHLIAIDDHSTDGTWEFLAKLWEERGNITCIRPARKCQGGAEILNIGLKHCRNNLLVTMNNDIVVIEGWLEEAVRCLESDPTIGIVGLKYLYPDGRIQHAGGTFIKGSNPYHIGVGEPGDSHSETEEALWVSGPCCLFRRECIGDGWDEDYDTFGGHEDVDLCLSARKKGWKVLYCGRAKVYHEEGATIMTLPNVMALSSRARQIFSAKWDGSPLLQKAVQ